MQVGCELVGGLPDAPQLPPTVATNPAVSYPHVPDMANMSSYYTSYPDYRPPQPPDEYQVSQGGGCGEYDPRMPPHPYYATHHQQGYPRYPPYDRLMNSYYVNAQTPQHPHTPHGHHQPHDPHDYRDPSPAAPTCMGQQASPPLQQYPSCKMQTQPQGQQQQAQQPQQQPQQCPQQPQMEQLGAAAPQDTAHHMAAQDGAQAQAAGPWPAQQHTGQQPPLLQQQPQNNQVTNTSPLYPWMRSQFGELKFYFLVCTFHLVMKGQVFLIAK